MPAERQSEIRRVDWINILEGGLRRSEGWIVMCVNMQINLSKPELLWNRLGVFLYNPDFISFLNSEWIIHIVTHIQSIVKSCLNFIQPNMLIYSRKAWYVSDACGTLTKLNCNRKLELKLSKIKFCPNSNAVRRQVLLVSLSAYYAVVVLLVAFYLRHRKTRI